MSKPITIDADAALAELRTYLANRQQVDAKAGKKDVSAKRLQKQRRQDAKRQQMRFSKHQNN